MTERICVFGSSTAFGQGDIAGGGWVNRLRMMLVGEQADAVVFNLSVPGDDTYDVLIRFSSEFTAREGTVVVFDLGLNDCQLSVSYPGPKVPLEAFAANLGLVFRLAARLAKTIIFIDMYKIDEQRTIPCAWDLSRSFRAELVDTYRHRAINVCSKYEVLRVNTSGLFRMSELVDGVHPGAEGHARLAEKVRGVLSQIIPPQGQRKISTVDSA